MDERSVRIHQFWEDRGRRIEDPTVAARFRADDRLGYDLRLAAAYCRPESKVLDLGAGTCELSCHLAPHVREIVAVDFVEELLTKRALPANIRTVVSDARDFIADELFDVILVYGVLNYIMDDADVARVYCNINSMLAPGGVCIIKHQSGVRETIVVDKFSEEFGTHYIATYRHRDVEAEMMSDLFDVQTMDIYPAHLNRWDNTHFYAYVCHQKVPSHQVIADTSLLEVSAYSQQRLAGG